MSTATTSNQKLLAWIEEVTQLCQPAAVHWCDGSQQEYNALCDLMVKGGAFTKLDEKELYNLGTRLSAATLFQKTITTASPV